MKRFIAVILTISLALAGFIFAHAEDLVQKSDDELSSMREELLTELRTINVEIGRRYRERSEAGSNSSLGKIKELFPDEALAMVIRDKCAKFSIEQTVTQAELDEIWFIQLFSCEHGDFTDLTGIGYLRNLQTFSLYNDMDYLGTFFPEEFYTLVNLKTIEVAGSNLETLSESLGNLVNLKTLNISRTNVSALPESIGNLVNLKSLEIGYTKITSLPDSIWALQLTNLNMADLPIK